MSERQTVIPPLVMTEADVRTDEDHRRYLDERMVHKYAGLPVWIHRGLLGESHRQIDFFVGRLQRGFIVQSTQLFDAHTVDYDGYATHLNPDMPLLLEEAQELILANLGIEQSSV